MYPSCFTIRRPSFSSSFSSCVVVLGGFGVVIGAGAVDTPQDGATAEKAGGAETAALLASLA